MDTRSRRPTSSNVIIANAHGGALSDFRSAKGKTIRVLDSAVYRKATLRAGKVLGDIKRPPSPSTK